jgi:hypothetical protein
MATQNSQAMFNMLAQQLRQMGLGQLFQVDAQGQPSGWLWNQMQAGVDTAEELGAAIQQTDVFRERFGVIVEQQRRAAAGEAVYVMSPAEVIQYETTARQMMRKAGLPPTFYDKPEDFNQLILADISPQELDQRLGQAFEYVQAAPPEVRDAFREFYGVTQGDAHLAAWALNPERTLVDIERATRTAYAGGMAKRFDISLSRAASERIAALPRTEAGITEGLTQLAQQANVFEEGLFEVGDISAENQGIAAVFEGDADAAREMERRVIRRRSPDQSSTGGAVLTNQGLIGSASA